jgi:outer membrane immunogenic protein
MAFLLGATCVPLHAQSLPQPLQPLGSLPTPLDWVIPHYTELQAPYNWTGFLTHPIITYQSVSFGGSGGRYLNDANGLGLGLEADYNFQYGNIVFGPAADLEYSFARGDSRYSVIGTTAPEVDVTGTLRGRIGYAFDRTLIYATGGYAFANVKVDNRSLGISDTHLLSGVSLGGGAEYLWSEHAVLRLEYRYNDLASQSFQALGNRKVSGGINVISSGFSYKF